MTLPIADPAEVLHWLGGHVDIRVEIDTGVGDALSPALWDVGLWDEDLWGSEDPDWFDMTRWVESIAIEMGAERWGERFQAGTAQIVVENISGIFSPGVVIPDDPFVRAYRPGRKVRVVAIPDEDTGTKVPLFTGRLDSTRDTHDPATQDIRATLHCVDFMGDWAAFDALAQSATGVQTTDERVEAALDLYEWPADERDIQAGEHTVQSSDLAGTTLENAQAAADAEGGAFFASKDGRAVFKARDWLTTDTRSTVVQGYIGYSDVPTDAQAAYEEDPEPGYELARVVNIANYQREGGAVQTSTDEASIQANGRRSQNVTGLQNNADAEVLALAVRTVASLATARLRIDSVSIAGVEDPDNDDLNRLLWATELGDRVSVLVDTVYGWSIERELHVMGIRHEITGDDWRVRFRLDDAQTLDLEYWVLGDPVLGVLGETTRVS